MAGCCGKKCLLGIIPSAVLIFLVLGTILLGIATPTESGAMGAMGALLLAWLRRAQNCQSQKTNYRVLSKHHAPDIDGDLYLDRLHLFLGGIFKGWMAACGSNTSLPIFPVAGLDF